MSFKRNHWIFNVRPRFWPLVSWKTYPNIWTWRLLNVQQPWSVLHLHLGVGWYCVGGLSCTGRSSCNDVHHFCCCHLSFVQWILHGLQSRLSQCHLGTRLVLYPSGILFLTQHFLRWHVHLWNKVDFPENIFLALHFLQITRRFFQLLPFFVHGCFRIRNFHRSRHRNKFVHQVAVTNCILFLRCDLDDLSVELVPNAFS